MKSFNLLLKFSIRHLWRQKWQSVLLITGILLGVAVVIAIDYANASSKKAITLSTQSITGTATHQILSSGTGISEKYFTDMKRMGIFEVASPIVEGYVNVVDFNQQPKLILGIDPLLDFPFRSYYGSGENQLSQLFSVISEPLSGIISKKNADEFGISLGQTIEFQTEGRTKQLKIVGVVSSDEPIIQDSLDGLIIVDISTAQEILNRVGLLDRIELILNDETTEDLVSDNLTSDLILRTTKDQNIQIENMVAAFQLNLTALSLLALVVGGFLIYNTMTFSVVQRRELIGLYRSLGFYRSEIFLMIIIEAIIIGLIGTFLGVLVGSLLGKGTVNLILQTINDLYYVTTVRSVSLPLESVVKGVILGIFATILVSIPPAWEATQVTPRTAKIKSNFEDKVKKYIGYLFLLGLFLIGLSYFLLFSPYFQNLWWSFTATLFVVIAFSIFTAICLFLILPPLSKFIKRKIGMIPGMATRELYRSLSRTAVAVASLMVAVAVTIGMAIMINSFRNTVNVWLRETLSGDIYISVPNQFSNRSSAYIDSNAVSEILSYGGIEKFDTLLTINGISSKGDVQINVITNQEIAEERIFIGLESPINDVWNELLDKKILISEPLANRMELEVGSVLQIQTPGGNQGFEVLG
ncbi:MAG TPA: FtsX-like permease family protein, partial [Anaerolineaceae bacterium]|nr:FtsX-like permease family protein [Anaerolineaceae bacterium]